MGRDPDLRHSWLLQANKTKQNTRRKPEAQIVGPESNLGSLLESLEKRRQQSRPHPRLLEVLLLLDSALCRWWCEQCTEERGGRVPAFSTYLLSRQAALLLGFDHLTCKGNEVHSEAWTQGINGRVEALDPEKWTSLPSGEAKLEKWGRSTEHLGTEDGDFWVMSLVGEL